MKMTDNANNDRALSNNVTSEEVAQTSAVCKPSAPFGEFGASRQDADCDD